MKSPNHQLLVALSTLLSITALADPTYVVPDASFPAGSGPNNFVRAVALQPNSHILVAGLFTNVSGLPRSYLARINADGAVDSEFAPSLDAEPSRLEPLPDGCILISGGFTNVDGVSAPGVARLTFEGRLDTGFVPPSISGPKGTLATMAAPGSKVFICGSFTNVGGEVANRVARLLEDGSFDPSFHSPFSSTGVVSLAAVQADGKPVFLGSSWDFGGLNLTNLVRLNLDGSLDASFRCGIAPTERASRVMLQPDGRLLAVVTGVIDD